MSDSLDHEATLAEGAWHPEVHAALLDLINGYGVNSEGYDPERPPLVVVDLDETLLINDLGEALLRYMVTRRQIHADRGFWNLIPDRLGREGVRSAYSAIAGRGDPEVKDTAAYRRYRAGLIGAYEALRSQDGSEAAYTFAARLLRGLHERTVGELVEAVLDHEFDRAVTNEEIPAGPPFAGLVVPVGLRVYREMLNLIELLETYGFETWIISAAAEPAVKAVARRLGLAEERALGTVLATQSGAMTDRIEDTVPVGEARLELFLDTVGRSPVLAIGDSMVDFELLENCEGISIVIDQGDELLAQHAEENGWLVQAPLTF